MKNTVLGLVLMVLVLGCKNPNKQANIENEEWIPLFNGKDLNDWDIKIAGHDVGVNYNNTFQVEDSMIRVNYDAYENFENAFGHLYYKQPFSYYKIRLEYRFIGEQVAGGASWATKNSGIMLHSQSVLSNSLGQFFPVSIEFQFLGGLQEGVDRPTGNLCTPGTTAEMNGITLTNHCTNSNSDTYYDEQWVSVEAIVLGGESITHIVNKDTVLVYQHPKIGGGLINGAEGEWESNGIANKEAWLAKEGEPLTEGFLALQAESHPIDFKNIELLNLCGCLDKKAKNYKAYYVKADNSKCIY
ncbi:3-keto-disaccharide hydrolase [Flavobacteriaceae bacterium LMO-SS05]